MLKRPVKAKDLEVGSVVQLAVEGYYEGSRTTSYLPANYATKGEEVLVVGPAQVAGNYATHFGRLLALRNGVPHVLNSTIGVDTKAFIPLSAAKTKVFRATLAEAVHKNPSTAFYRCSTTLGADPEVFVVNKKGEPIPAWTFLPSQKEADKANPLLAYPTVKQLTYYDGVQAEFNTIPAACLAFLVDSFQHGLKNVLTAAKKVDKDARLTWASVLDVPPAVLETAEQKYVELGCSPSLNAYPDSPSIQVDNPRALPFRFAGCHMHFTAQSGWKEIYPTLVQGLDAMLGVAMVSLFAGMEDDRRRSFYGMAGEYRTPAHGLEYRVPPAAMLAHPILVHVCYELARSVLGAAQNGIAQFWDAKERETRDIINTCDVKGARKVLKRNEKMFSALCDRANIAQAPKMRRLVLEGAKELLPVDEMEKNWKLAGTWITHSDGKDESLWKWQP